jgi:hypothetical protein
VADCGEGWVFLGGIFFESGEVKGGEYYQSLGIWLVL